MARKETEKITHADFSSPLTIEGGLSRYSATELVQISQTAEEILEAQTAKKLDIFFDRWINLVLTSSGDMDLAEEIYVISLEVMDFVESRKKLQLDLGIGDFSLWASKMVEVLKKARAQS